MQVALGNAYRDGNGVRQGNLEAIRWYRASADLGYAAGQYSLGIVYRSRNPPDYTKALRWFKQAAEQG